MAMSSMIGQIGCVTAFVAILIIAIAFAAGWYLDNLLGNERKIITVILLLLSFPVTLFAMFRVSLIMIGRTQDRVENINQENKEETT